MNTIVCKDPKDLSRAATDWCSAKAKKYRARSLFVPAGRTPIALYAHWTAIRPAFLEGLELVQIDDLLGEEKPDLFRRFFQDHLGAYENSLRFIGRAEQVADLAILGLGLNGHVAFHEPGIQKDFFSGCVRLEDSTCDTLGVKHGTWGVTYGTGAFLRTKAVLITVTGAGKRDILQRLLQADPDLPASALLTHSDLTILADQEALPGGARS